MLPTRAAILQQFALVQGTPYQRYKPDDWCKPYPASFHCSSFVQWLALRVLGWSEAEKAAHDPPNARALSTAPRKSVIRRAAAFPRRFRSVAGGDGVGVRGA